MMRWLLGLVAFVGAVVAAILGTRRDRPRLRDIRADVDNAHEVDWDEVSQDLARIETERVTAEELAARRHRERIEREATVEDARRLIEEARRGSR